MWLGQAGREPGAPSLSRLPDSCSYFIRHLCLPAPAPAGHLCCLSSPVVLLREPTRTCSVGLATLLQPETPGVLRAPPPSLPGSHPQTCRPDLRPGLPWRALVTDLVWNLLKGGYLSTPCSLVSVPRAGGCGPRLSLCPPVSNIWF